jgi:hypothetical protein
MEKGGSSLLYFAAKKNSTRMAWRLLEYGADINARYGSPSRSLSQGDHEYVTLQGANVFQAEVKIR